MHYFVYDASGTLRYESECWPMARAALDHIISQSEDEDCPRLVIFPESAQKERAAD